ncbi:hypothetical protein EZV73_14960 [Acidaminobacter sp. JC074]|uniref:hypothetical protein n=1 Tax=Acidaminobacter sp. JC074 TaxID=2530199 RepID=UPI001F10F920|nr:hypothetical protein [Acidaminobacter sp. JC074]MCH4888894.1 hypothetical protein [Acidaminobacter sp. JC074]
MIDNSIRDYFLDKPGTFEDEEKSYVTLNLASEKILELHQDYVDLKLDEATTKKLLDSSKGAKLIKEEGKFSWNHISVKDISFTDLCDLIDQSYESVINTLPEDEQKEILDLEW